MNIRNLLLAADDIVADLADVDLFAVTVTTADTGGVFADLQIHLKGGSRAEVAAMLGGRLIRLTESEMRIEHLGLTVALIGGTA